MTETIRLNKYLANAGVVSRRKVGELVKAQKVLVNGKPALEPGQRIDPGKDKIVVDGRELKPNANFVYIILNKPLGVVSTTSDEHNRQAVTDLVTSPVKLYPVGRLDSDSVGLILLTNDGELTHKLTHPKFHIPKTYQVIIKGEVNKDQLQRLQQGVVLKDGLTAPAKVSILEKYRATTKLQFIIHEGRNRQIRRMCTKVGLSDILELKRTAIDSISLNNLQPGEYRELTSSEIKSLKQAVGM